MAIALLGASYVWDLQQGESCELAEAMLEFYGAAVRWYAGVVGAAVLGVLRVVAMLQPNKDWELYRCVH